MSNLPQSVSKARFGVYEVDFRAGELLKNNRKVRLQDQPLQVLAMLLEKPGEVVTRDGLRQKLWPGDTFVDFDHGLNNAVNRLREALNDSADTPKFIETLPRRGYRFIAPIEFQNPSDSQAPRNDSGIAGKAAGPEGDKIPEQLHAQPGQSPLKQRWIVYAISAAAFFVIAALALRTRPLAFFGSAHAMRIESLAVLPLENLTGDSAEEHLVDGMTDALTTNLAQIGELRVISRTSAMQFKGVKTSLPEIARQLRVDAVVEGSVSKSDKDMHINAQLIYAPADRHIWARSYDGAHSNLSAIVDDIAHDVAHKIGVGTASEPVGSLQMPRSVNPDAYDLYLRAEPYYGVETKAANDEAIKLLEGSVTADNSFAAGYAALATAYRVRAFSVDTENTEEWVEKATAAVQKSLSIDANLAEAYVSRGYLLWSRANNWAYERAVKDYRQALQLNPNLAEAHHQLANIYNHVGLLDKADEEIKKAVAVDPLNSGIRYRVGINLLYQGKFEESIPMMRDSQKFMPTLWAFQTSFALQHLGRHQEAQEKIENLLKAGVADTSGSLGAMQALLAADGGDTVLAERKIKESVSKARGYQHFHHVAYAVASAYALLNKSEPALQYLRLAADDGFPCYPLFEHDSNLDKLRRNPGFLSFMAEQKKQWEYFGAHL